MEAIGYIILILSIICTLLLVGIFLKLQKAFSNSNDMPADTATRLALLNTRINDLGSQLKDEFERSRRESSNVQKDMRNETAKALDTMSDQLRLMMKANFESQQQLTNSLSVALDKIRRDNMEQNDRQSKIIAQAINEMQQSNEKKLDQMRQTVDEKLNSTLSARLDSSFKTVSEQLENVYKSLGEMKELSNGVTTNVTNLNRVLTNVKARGTWAEVQLEGILDQTIPNMYDKNVATSGTLDRVEFAVKIPSGDSNDIAYLPIDSKFPMEDYIRLCDAADRADADEVAKARKALEDRVLSEAKMIKKYINVPKTTPFAIMYLATEGLYAEIASSRTGISEKIQNEYNIMIAGPTTITALLNSLSMGFKAVAINEKANEVRQLLTAAKGQYEKFGDILAKAKKKIDEAGKTLVLAQDRNRIMHNKLKGIEEMSAEESDEYLGINESFDLD